ncbi:MAG: HlyD family secretion protein [Acidiferrobacterales bacterium]
MIEHWKHPPWRAALLVVLSLLACTKESSEPEVVGTLEWDRIELIAETGEPIVEIRVREGDTVEAEQIVLRQEATRYRAELDETKATRAQAAARLAELKRGPRSERISEGRARLAGAESMLDARNKDLQRIRSLVSRKLISIQDLDRARAERDAAQADRDAARAELEELLAGTTAEELKQAEDALARAEAAVRATRVTLERLTIRAPQAGRVDALPYKLGERPSSGAAVAILLGGEAPYARVYIPEKMRVQITPGRLAQVHIDGTAQPFAARVRSVSQEATFTPYFALTERDRSRLSYIAEVVLTEPDATGLPAGLPVRVTFPDLATQ